MDRSGDTMAPRLGVAAGNARALALVLVLVLAATSLVLPAFLGADGSVRIDTAGHRARPGTATPHVVEMQPMGCVTFDGVPRRVVTLDAHYNDLLVAVGHSAGLVATGSAENFFDGFYEALGSIARSVDRRALTYLYGRSGAGFDKETLYALDADVHHIDPTRLARSRGWTEADVAEVARNVGPFFANRYSRTNDHPGDEPYTYYELWDLCERVAAVYLEDATIRSLRAVHDAMVARIRAKLPPPEDRPTVGLVLYSNGRFLPFAASRPGFGTAQYRAVGARDAFADIRDLTYADAGRGTRIDIEAMLAIDPDVLIVPWAIYAPERYHALAALADHPLGQRLSAVRNGRTYPGGSPLQGPVFHLFQVEMAAKQIYPELFGPFREDLDYARGEWLFDRRAVVEALRNAGQR